METLWLQVEAIGRDSRLPPITSITTWKPVCVGGVRNGSVGGNYTVGWIVYTVNFRLLVPSKCKTKLTNRMQAILKHLLTLIDSSVFCFSVRGTSNLNSSRRFQKKSKTFQQLYSCLR